MLLGFFMISVFAATATELAELKPIGRGLFILGRYVVAALTYNTLKNNIIAWHLFLLPISDCRFPICVHCLVFPIGNRQLAIGNRQCFSDLKFQISDLRFTD